FKEFFVSITLREISQYFDNHNIPYTELGNDINYGGQRRTLVENYYTGLDWTNADDCRKVINVYQDILNDLEDSSENVWNAEDRKKWFIKLSNLLKRDGFTYHNGKLALVGQTVNFDDLQNATNLLDKTHFQEYIDRIKKSVTEDPGLAIGSTKELLE